MTAPEAWLDRRWLVALVAVDLVFVLLHVSHVQREAPAAPAFALTLDGGHAERWQYGKTALVAAVLLLLAWQRRRALLAAWAGVFTFVLLDDALSLHEGAGRVLTRALRPRLGRGFDGSHGELIYFAVGGALVLAAFALVLRAQPAQRWSALDTRLLVLTAVLGVCGVGLDFVHALRPDSQTLAVLEDGGELFAMSALAALVMRAFARRPRPTAAARAPSAG